MHALEMTCLAGGAAISLLCGAATAQFGLAPLGDAVARLETKANPIAFTERAAAADNVQIQAAAYAGYAPAAGYFSEAGAADGRSPLEGAVASKTQTEARALETGETEDRRDRGYSAPDEDSDAAPQRSPVWQDTAAKLADLRDGRATEEPVTGEGPQPASRESDLSPESGR